MTEIPRPEFQSRIFTERQTAQLRDEVLTAAMTTEPWREKASANISEVEAFVDRSIGMIRSFEQAAKPHPQLDSAVDVIYIDSGPGPYSLRDDRLQVPETSFTYVRDAEGDLVQDAKGNFVKKYLDTNYHHLPFTREMDRDRLRAAYAAAGSVTALRLQAETGEIKPTGQLAEEDFARFGPYLLYAGADYQTSHIAAVIDVLHTSGHFRIPDGKVVIYNSFTDGDGQSKKIVHTEDQMEGLQLPKGLDGLAPKKLLIVSHASHLMRLLHILAKYPNSIPEGTQLQLFPVPMRLRTNGEGPMEYAKAELLGTLGTVFKKNRASLMPFDKYVL